MRSAMMIGAVAMGLTANPAWGQTADCQYVARAMAAAPKFIGFRGAADPGNKMVDGVDNGIWKATRSMPGARCQVQRYNPESGEVTSYHCEWDSASPKAFHFRLGDITKFVKTCPQWKIGRTQVIAPTDHVLYTADNRYAFIVYWEPESMITLDVARAADVKAVMAASPPD